MGGEDCCVDSHYLHLDVQLVSACLFTCPHTVAQSYLTLRPHELYVVCQALLSMESSGQEYWSGLENFILQDGQYYDIKTIPLNTLGLFNSYR